MYLVVNHQEKAICEDTTYCSKNETLIYNTNVVLDRKGQVIARYRKFNLYGERGTNVTKMPGISTFTTDFDVTFGQFICFDIFFQRPALNLTNNFNITDIITPQHWYFFSPFFSSIGVHAAWSYANDVNLLASGNNEPKTASGGIKEKKIYE